MTASVDSCSLHLCQFKMATQKIPAKRIKREEYRRNVQAQQEEMI
jgi:hypothetical protein